jgi:signal transduction histidine kinase
MFSSLRFRLWLTYVLVVGVMIGIAGTVLVLYLARNPAIDRQELQRLRVLSQFLLQRNQLFSLPLDTIATERLREAIGRADRISGVRVAMFNSSGELLADSRSATAAALPDWRTLARRVRLAVTIFRDSSGRQWIYTMTRTQEGNYLFLAAPRLKVPLWNILREEFLSPFVQGALLALSLSLLLAFWIARWITAPLQRIADAAPSVSTGKFQKIVLQGPGEVQALVKAFNEMGDQVQASQRSQRDFVANVSHDLKTPLTSIQGFAQAILDGTAGDAAALKQAAEVIYTEAERMYRMVQDLLDLARLDSGIARFEQLPIDLGSLLHGVVQKFTPQARQSQIDLQFIGEDVAFVKTPLTLVGDRDRLIQVFSNLVDNALKYTPADGQVVVRMRLVESEAEVQVADTGPGISPEDQGRIFERFYQTDKSRSSGSRQGVGLGLAIAREIVQAHGGVISVYNREDAYPGKPRPTLSFQEKGSVFVVKLPLKTGYS